MTHARHWRQTMREGAKQSILEAGTLAGGRVYAERLTRLNTRSADQFPCVCVFVKRDDGTHAATGPFDTRADVMIGIFATGEATGLLTAEEVASNTRDALCDEVERALLADGRWEAASSIERVTRLQTECDFVEGEILIAMATITIAAQFHADILPVDHGSELATVTITNDNATADEVIDTYDEIAIPLDEE
ncbi:MAG: hypothetical protein IT385_08165 [Deltaproteobacteria bacterium]|nr:hypothetical protein [Deltaproteobacteria bacterium]